MIVPEHVQCAVDHEAYQLLMQALAGVSTSPPTTDWESFRIGLSAHDECSGRCWADVHIAEDGAIGLREGEGEDVREATPPGNAPIQTPHRGGAEERELDTSVALSFPPHDARRHPRQLIRPRDAPAARPS